MKKFKFSLEKVLRHRHIQLELAQKDFMEAQNELNAENKKLQDMIQIKEESLGQRARLVQSSQPIPNWSQTVEQINQYLSGQDLRIKNQNLRLLDIEKVVEAKREILRKASVEVKIIEKLKEKKLIDFNQEFARQEQNEMDELSVLRFSRNENPIKGSHEDGI